jgi:hypothetical protein
MIDNHRSLIGKPRKSAACAVATGDVQHDMQHTTTHPVTQAIRSANLGCHVAAMSHTASPTLGVHPGRKRPCAWLTALTAGHVV